MKVSKSFVRVIEGFTFTFTCKRLAHEGFTGTRYTHIWNWGADIQTSKNRSAKGYIRSALSNNIEAAKMKEIINSYK